MTDEIILPDDQHAAEKVNVDLWRSRSGTLFNSEDAARYHSSTHRRCDLCDAVCEKYYTICSEGTSSETLTYIPAEARGFMAGDNPELKLRDLFDAWDGGMNWI